MTKFIKSALVNGLAMLLPVVLVFLAIREIFELLVNIATPIADFFPVGTFDHVKETEVIAVLLIAGLAFFLGVLSKMKAGQVLGHGIEKYTLNKIPMYRMLKIISAAMVGGDTDGVTPAIVKDGSGGGDPCYVIEKHKDGRATVLMPWSPASFAGTIRIVQQANLEFVDCSLDDFSRAIGQIGVGIEECMTGKSSK